MLFQVQYRCTVKPTVSLLRKALSAFANGARMPRGVTVVPIAWTGTVDGLKAVLRAKQAFLGPAGIVKTYAKSNQTFCDYDGKYRAPIHRIVRLGQMCGIYPKWMREDRTAHGWHGVICWSRRLRPLEIVALQCLLGSDLERETYNLARVMSGKKSRRWNLLFERKL